MRCLPFKIILALLFCFISYAQSPHGGNFRYDCGLCHESTSWKIDVKKVKFDHSITKFELVGQHKTADCRGCHTELVFSKINSDCVSCHTDLHQGTVGEDCSKCHTSKTWMVEDINGLHQKGRFPLLGNHLTADCQQCHARSVDLYFEPLNTDCFACHQSDYNATQSPNHITANFSTQCEDCHNITAASWSTVNVVHDFFPLAGGHTISDCFACHESGGNFSGLSSECFACHEDDYNNPANDPNHITANFPTQCQQCHTIYGWSPSSFDHGLTEFPLTGSHINTECSSCHSSGFTGTPTDCFACHQDDFNSAQDPNHIQSNFPTTCAVCHNTTAWEPATFDHALTAFSLTGKHITTDCQECHSTGYTGTPTDCFACHQGDYNLTQDPNHVLKGYSTTCAECHSTNAWDEIINFNHSITQFQLTGAHISTNCNQCHQQGYTNTPTDCYVCHTEDYNNTTNPNHTSAGFPTTCIDCHTTTAWVPSTFDHDGQYFPIYTGKHAGEWTLCADCHQIPNNFAVFTCISCHEHNQLDMDDKHSGVQGYVYESNACLSCHPDGTKGNAFNHSNSIFPLTGAHIAVDCSLCHQNGYSGTPTQCLACHQNHYNNSVNPSHTLLSLPTECEQCHTTNPDWYPASFAIHNQYFELLGAHANVSNCVDCHNGNYNNTPNTCVGCHQNEYNGTTNPPHQLLNFSTDCLQCHNMNGWLPANFNHSFYPISNEHNNVDCSQCHSQSNYQPQCLSCHMEDFLDKHNPGDPTNCWDCHTTFNWDIDSPGLKQFRNVE